MNSELLATYRFPLPLPSVNATLHAHWRDKKRAHDAVKNWAGWAMKGRTQPIAGRVKLVYTCYFKHLNHDADNLHSKYVTDTLVKLGVLPNDNATVIRSVEHAIERTPTRDEFTILEVFRA